MIFKTKNWILTHNRVWGFSHADNTTPKLTASNAHNIHPNYGVYVEADEWMESKKITVIV
jgi:hypothetical protein